MVYSHGTSTEVEQFHVIVTFEEQGGKTRLGMHFPPKPDTDTGGAWWA
ncbi:hypothetical protein F0U63_43115 [Cystobacter fuscus]|nr:hypothetical protein F0U63_43115 [Cystobacter fuscus]